MEIKKKREHFFNNWLTENMPNNITGCGIMDIDFLISNYETKTFLLIELKTKGNSITNYQKQIYNILHKRLIKTNGTDGWKYVGTHLILFQNTNFDDGYCEFNGNFIKEDELLYKLNNLLGMI